MDRIVCFLCLGGALGVGLAQDPSQDPDLGDRRRFYLKRFR